jgi:protein-tyrosine phosphatase
MLVLGGWARQFLHYRIVDMNVPTQEYLRQIVEELAARLEGGHQLYIHCWGGRGRAGTVGAALLSKLYPGLSAEEALEHVQVSALLSATGATRVFGERVFTSLGSGFQAHRHRLTFDRT